MLEAYELLIRWRDRHLNTLSASLAELYGTVRRAMQTACSARSSVTTRPYDARRDAPLSRRQTRHNERSSETEGSALSLLFYYFSNLEPATRGISTSAKALSCFPPIIGNLNIATISHLASL